MENPRKLPLSLETPRRHGNDVARPPGTVFPGRQAGAAAGTIPSKQSQHLRFSSAGALQSMTRDCSAVSARRQGDAPARASGPAAHGGQHAAGSGRQRRAAGSGQRAAGSGQRRDLVAGRCRGRARDDARSSPFGVTPSLGHRAAGCNGRCCGTVACPRARTVQDRRRRGNLPGRPGRKRAGQGDRVARRCGAVRCGAVRCGAVRCGAVRCRDDASPPEAFGVTSCRVKRCGAPPPSPSRHREWLHSGPFRARPGHVPGTFAPPQHGDRSPRRSLSGQPTRSENPRNAMYELPASRRAPPSRGTRSSRMRKPAAGSDDGFLHAISRQSA